MHRKPLKNKKFIKCNGNFLWQLPSDPLNGEIRGSLKSINRKKP